MSARTADPGGAGIGISLSIGKGGLGVRATAGKIGIGGAGATGTVGMGSTVGVPPSSTSSISSSTNSISSSTSTTSASTSTHPSDLNSNNSELAPSPMAMSAVCYLSLCYPSTDGNAITHFIHSDFDNYNIKSDIGASTQTASASSHSSISGGNPAGTGSSLTTTPSLTTNPTKISTMDSSSPKDVLSAGAIAGTAIGLLFVLAGSVGIFILVYRRRHQAVMANLVHVSPLLTDNVAHTESGGDNFGMITPQEKSSYIHYPSISQTEPGSEIRQSSFIPGLNPLLLVPPQGDGDPDDRRVTVETIIIERMAEHIHYLESQLAGDGFSEAPPPTYVSS
ncbi:hypothetical protein BDP27DRAFT_1426865 [Rhodocollybia butyracea]|uniref:Uncharacterized protein n=1 Tax=Rhodocollybia butyracea TaxID=206335 RepID=A0A9P5U211_9AGAR|nr:hypothetical protein BDP27DRAFT_1426865 [Rhodocollybia butyracea]